MLKGKVQPLLARKPQAIAFMALVLVLEKHPDNADYLQTFG